MQFFGAIASPCLKMDIFEFQNDQIKNILNFYYLRENLYLNIVNF